MSHSDKLAHEIAIETSLDIIASSSHDHTEADGTKWFLLRSSDAASLRRWMDYLYGRGLLLRRRGYGGYVRVRFLAPGYCRHCGCSQDNACEPPCSWANPQQTVCTNPKCLRAEAKHAKPA